MAWALLGTVGFSGSAPATRAVVLACGPLAAAFGRVAVAVCAAGLVLLLVDRGPGRGRASRRHWLRLAVVTATVVLAFPGLTAVALARAPSTHMALMVGVLPVLTALWGSWRARERPSVAFWLASATGFAAITTFVLVRGGAGLAPADALLLAAAVVASLGYSEGAVLARELGGWRVICWALVLAAPMLLGGALVFPAPVASAAACVLSQTPAAMGIAYLGFISMLLAFFAWYHGLALGGIARAGQAQLAQLPLSLAWAALLLGERVDVFAGITTAVVIGSLLVVVKTRVARPAPLPEVNQS